MYLDAQTQDPTRDELNASRQPWMTERLGSPRRVLLRTRLLLIIRPAFIEHLVCARVCAER